MIESQHARKRPETVVARHLALGTKIDMGRLAAEIGLETAKGDLGEYLGELRQGPDYSAPWLAVVHWSATEQQRRFVLANLIVHHVFNRFRAAGSLTVDRAFRTGLDDATDKDAIRRTCDLVMPNLAIERLWQAGVRDAPRVAKALDVPLEAAQMRLSGLGLDHPGGAVMPVEAGPVEETPDFGTYEMPSVRLH